MGGDLFIVVFSGISALSNLVIAWETAKSNDKDLSIEEMNRIGQETEDSFFLNSGFIPNELRTIIDPETQNIILNNIREAELRLIDALGDGSNTQQTKDKEIDVASHTICSELRRIMRLNNGSLPNKEFERIWQSHRCVNI